MTPANFDELVDELFERRRRGESVSAILSNLPADLDGQSQRCIADLFTLDEACRDRHLPMPSTGFANGVITVLRTPEVAVSSTNAPRVASWRVPAFSVLAASLLVAVVMLPSLNRKDEPSTVVAFNDVAKPTEEVIVPQTVRLGTEAYMELVQSVASTIQPESPALTVEERQLASASPIGRAIHGSTETIRTAGEGLRASVEPITSSALDAFGFLWRTKSPVEDRPST